MRMEFNTHIPCGYASSGPHASWASTMTARRKSFRQQLQEESAITLVREAMWRARRRWLQRRFDRRHWTGDCPVLFRPAGYYDLLQRLCGTPPEGPIVAYTEALCRGEFRFLGYPEQNPGLSPQWNVDFVSGKAWPQETSSRLITVAGDGSDVKVPWELSRLQFLPVMAKAFRLTGDSRYRSCVFGLLSDWIDKNPLCVGINWTIAMEAALRAISICMALELLWPFSADEQQSLYKIERSLWQHLEFIEAHSEFSHFCHSNHYLSNISGLYCLCSFLQGSGMASRRDRYRAALEREIRTQVYVDGGDKEASTGYHVLVTQLFTVPFHLGLAMGDAFSGEYADRLAEMFRWITVVADESGRLPHLGDCDDGRVELLSEDLEQMQTPLPQRDSLKVGSMVSLGRALFPSAQLHRTAVPGSRSPEVNILPQSGIAVARFAGAEVVFLAIPNGLDGKGSHTHNDKLSFVLRVDGKELLCDSGTGTYSRDAALRNRLRATSAHNTLSIELQEQNRFDPQRERLFQMCNDAIPTSIQAAVEENSVKLSAAHSGYVRLGISHTRSLRLADGELNIMDTLEGSGIHGFQLTFQLPVRAADVSIVENAEFRTCSVPSLRGLQISCYAPPPLEVKKQSSEISHTYGLVSEAARLIVSGRSVFPIKIATRITWS